MEAIEKTELNILSEIGRISNSAASLAQKLQQIVAVVARGMGKDGASLFLIDRAGKNVNLTAALGLNQESIGRLSFPLGRGIAGWVAEQKVPLALEDPFSDPRFEYVPESDIQHFKSLAAAPILDEDACLGVLFVLSQDRWSASSSEVTLLTTTANQISGVIKSAQLFQSIQQRLSELANIYEISMALTTTLDIDQILSLIAQNTIHALGAQGCAIRLTALPGPAMAQPAASFSITSEAIRNLDSRIGERIVARTSAERRPLLIADIAAEPFLKDVPGLGADSLIAVPLIYHDTVIGVITLYHSIQDGSRFTEADLQFLSTIAGTAAAAVVNAAVYERMEELATEARNRAQELTILYDIGTAMGSTLNLDRLLRIILTAATMGGSGLGFNRAMLLMTNERTGILQGMMGVGPTTWEEAGRAWGEVAAQHKSLLEWVHTGDFFEKRDSAFNALARSIRIPVDRKEGVLALTVLEKKPFNIHDAVADPTVHRELRELLQANSFATVPLITKDRVIGVILVDNLFTQRPITDRDVMYLSMFANQAALAIENAVIYSNLETLNRDIRAMQQQLVRSEKMAALGAMMAEITHEIRNPLVSIGGFTRRLSRKIQDPDAQRYIEIILKEVVRLESVVHDNLSYLKDVLPQFQDADLNTVIDEVLALYEEELRQRGIRLDRGFSAEIPMLFLDPQQIKQAVINITTNAMEAMDQGGVLTIRTYALPEAREAAIEIGDTGPGIPTDVINNMFTAYYTTKARGTGLGLPITKRIVTAHKGRIEVRNKDTGGAVFTMRIPYKQE